jgi:hypothetical protein
VKPVGRDRDKFELAAQPGWSAAASGRQPPAGPTRYFLWDIYLSATDVAGTMRLCFTPVKQLLMPEETKLRNALIGMIAAACLLSSAPSFGADERNITIYNATGYGIKFIGVNPQGDDEFDENELSEVLKDGGSVYIKFNQADKGCNWSIKIDWEMEGYPSPLIRNIDLCTVNDIRLLYDDKTGVTSYQTR